jgi:hypothetical protein
MLRLYMGDQGRYFSPHKVFDCELISGSAGLERTTTMRRTIGVLAVSLFTLVMFTCSPKTNSPDNVNAVPIFETGKTGAYALSSGAALSVTDTVSGFTFGFPDGGIGTLTVKALTKVPDIDTMGGKGFYIEYTGQEKMNLLLPRSPDSEPQVWVYGNATVPLDFVEKADSIWMPLGADDSASTPAVFELGLPCVPYDSIVPLGKTLSQVYRKPSHSYYLYYKNETKVNNWAWHKIDVLWDITNKTITDLRGILPSAIQLDKYSDFQVRLKPTGAYSGWSTGYVGFRYYVGLIRSANPHFWYNVYGSNTPADDDAVAHECGHYISHILLGDDKYELLTRQSVKVHDIGDVHASRPMLEEYAFYACYYKGGHLLYQKYEIEDPNKLFKDKRSFIDKVARSQVTPARYDWPGIEAFGCAFLVRLYASTATVANFIDEQQEPVPLFEKSFTDIYGILALGPMTVNELYEKTLSTLTGEDQILMRVMAEKIGWSYHGDGKVLDSVGKGMKDVVVADIPVTNGTATFQNPLSAPSAADGSYTVDRIIPDSSILRFYYHKVNGKYTDSLDSPIYIDHHRKTTEAAALPTIRIGGVSSIAISPADTVADKNATLQWTATLTNPPPSVRYDWDFGDGSAVQSNVDNNKAGHAYTALGKFTVKCSAFNNATSKLLSLDSAHAQIMADTIRPATLSGKANMSYDFGIPVEYLALVASARFEWDFGDGTAMVNDGTGIQSHTYKKMGNYTITVKCYNAANNTLFKTCHGQVTIGFNYFNAVTISGSNITFQFQTQNGPSSNTSYLEFVIGKKVNGWGGGLTFTADSTRAIGAITEKTSITLTVDSALTRVVSYSASVSQTQTNGTVTTVETKKMSGASVPVQSSSSTSATFQASGAAASACVSSAEWTITTSNNASYQTTTSFATTGQTVVQVQLMAR